MHSIIVFFNQAVDILNTRTEETAELKKESDWLKRSKGKIRGRCWRISAENPIEC